MKKINILPFFPRGRHFYHHSAEATLDCTKRNPNNIAADRMMPETANNANCKVDPRKTAFTWHKNAIHQRYPIQFALSSERGSDEATVQCYKKAKKGQLEAFIMNILAPYFFKPWSKTVNFIGLAFSSSQKALQFQELVLSSYLAEQSGALRAKLNGGISY